MRCNICETNTEVIFTKRILNKYDVKYYQCANCRFIQTETPYWLDEAYGSAINFSDIGLLYRNKIFVENVTALFGLSKFEKNKKYLDYGGGYGIFVRMMRDNGYNFYWDDEYCKNMYAELFLAKSLPEKEQQYEVVTAFEVFEHLVNPMEEIQKMLKLTDSILFSTELTTLPINELQNWWYIGENHGQHVSLYNRKTLEYICNKFGLNLYSRKNLHFITKKKMNGFLFNVAFTYKLARLYNTFASPKTLLESDFKLYMQQK